MEVHVVCHVRWGDTHIGASDAAVAGCGYSLHPPRVLGVHAQPVLSPALLIAD